MSTTKLLAKHLREVYFGGNWTCSDFKANLKDVTWEQAITKVKDFNTIAVLFYHSAYYVSGVLQFLKGEKFESKDAESFSHPPITSQQDWEQMQQKVWDDVEAFAAIVEQLNDEVLATDFIESKYGNYFRNLNGIIEHSHYHLGQIVIIKKLL